MNVLYFKIVELFAFTTSKKEQQLWIKSPISTSIRGSIHSVLAGTECPLDHHEYKHQYPPCYDHERTRPHHWICIFLIEVLTKVMVSNAVVQWQKFWIFGHFPSQSHTTALDSESLFQMLLFLCFQILHKVIANIPICSALKFCIMQNTISATNLPGSSSCCTAVHIP